ncbi:MAG: electron transfer flavoprotein subunit alpha/FixB family protein [Thermaerobacter sp.]|nr:electron transfer flavoprotein subunit alpha/FixB family protein [Thermaerobacter sp.]
MGPIIVVVELQNDAMSPATGELLTRARQLAQARSTRVVALGFGEAARSALAASGADDAVLVVGADPYVPTLAEAALRQMVRETSAGLVLLANTTMGMDLGAATAAAEGRPMVAYVTSLTAVEGGEFTATSQVYAGKLVAEVAVPEGSVLTVLPGSWPADDAVAGGTPVREVAVAPESAMELVRTIEPETGDVDITRADVLVSVGRGIQDPDNLELADELAEALGAVVSCSRPVVDAGWLPRARQVGKSGQTVKPKLYLALGISGAPEHLQGMKDSEIIVAVNSDPAAPIFEVAHYGATCDILELMPLLTELLGEAG